MKSWIGILLIATTALMINLPLMAADKKFDIIDIEADHLQFNEKTGTNFYSGNVRMVQGELQVNAEQLQVYTQNNQLERIVARGKLQNTTGDTASTRVRFRHQTEQGKEVIAYAATLNYFEKESRLLLEGDAELTQASNHIRSPRIEYNIANQAVIAGDDKTQPKPSNPSRVRMTITPEKQK